MQGGGRGRKRAGARGTASSLSAAERPSNSSSISSGRTALAWILSLFISFLLANV